MSKKRRRTSGVKKSRPGRYESVRALYRMPTNRNQTVQRIVQTFDNRELYYTPAEMSKLNVVTNTIIRHNNQDFNLQQCFETSSVNPSNSPVPDFVRLTKIFRQIKFQWIKITLTPERYLTISPSGFQTGDEKDAQPVDLFYVNDDGSAALSLDNPTSIQLLRANELSAHQHGKMQFTKPISFYINPYEKLAAQKSSPNYTTFRQWTDTSSESDPNLSGTTYLPNDSFYYGFDDQTVIPDDFKFKVRIQASVLCRDLFLDQSI